MASRDDSSGSSRGSQQEDNPFIAFRRYADEQMANLLQSFIGLPSAFTTHSAIARWRPYDDQARRRNLDTWASQNEEDTTAWRGEARRQEAREAEEASARYSTPEKTYAGHLEDCTEEDERTLCPYRPAERQPRDETSFHTPTSTLLWPIGYMLFSPYSPYRLEQKEPFCDYGSRWRDAFEDLLSFEGKDAESREDSPSVACPAWIRSFNDVDPLGLHDAMKQFRHQLPDSFSENLGTRQPENDFDEEEMTELDLFEQLLQRQQPHRERSSTWIDDVVKEPRKSVHLDERKAQDTSARSGEGNKLGIVSTLTTTERIALPDGTVHTKMVLKKRFADGREESSETVHTTQGGLQNQQEQTSLNTTVKSMDATKPRNLEQTEKTQKKGWFWS